MLMTLTAGVPGSKIEVCMPTSYETINPSGSCVSRYCSMRFDKGYKQPEICWVSRITSVQNCGFMTDMWL